MNKDLFVTAPWFIVWGCALIVAWPVYATQIDITAARVEYAGKATAYDVQTHIDVKANTTATIRTKRASFNNFEVRNTQALLDWRFATPTLVFTSDIKRTTDKAWAQAKLNCKVPKSLQTEAWQCAQGLFSSERINFPFDATFQPKTKGMIADIQLKEASFSDEAGLHAAEKLTGNLHLDVTQEDEELRWTHNLNWTGGEMFWQPFYLAGVGHQFSGSGVLRGESVRFENAKLNLKDVGELQFSGAVRVKDYHLTQLDADLPNLNLSTAYPLIFKPLLEKTSFNNAEMDGKVSLKVAVRDAEIKAFDLTLRDVSIEDKNKKFAFYRINAHIPWDYDVPQKVQFAYESGTLLNLPLGRTQLNAEVNRYSVTAPNMTLPLMDGALQLSDVAAARIGVDWYWRLGAKLTPVSMADFSQALHLPRMEGKAAAEIPLVTYNQGQLTTDGDMTLNVFDGEVRVTNLSMLRPLGATPKLYADLSMRNLDLGALTRTFSFGAIEGKLDGDVKQLEMQNWKPIRFDASVVSSSGKYPKKISQRAVENISALGGAGAAAAIQRSFLQFFKQFNYEKMGMSCKLRNDICEMDGIASTPQGYVIVKGSGIPAITVLGYNHQVGWDELLARVKRVIAGNTQAVVK